jgi:hypothetical protein
MDLETALEEVREAYFDQFRDFVDRQRALHAQGSPELKFELSGTDAVFRRLYCADFVNTDGKADIIEFQPADAPEVEPFDTEFGFMDVRVDGLRWDKFCVEWEPKVISAEALNAWFETWFDPRGRRQDRTSEFAECIHCVVLTPDSLNIDLGTAPVDAVAALLEMMEAEGVERVRIS